MGLRPEFHGLYVGGNAQQHSRDEGDRVDQLFAESIMRDLDIFAYTFNFYIGFVTLYNKVYKKINIP